MPIPTPYTDESRAIFMPRCIRQLEREGTDTGFAKEACSRKFDISGDEEKELNPTEFILWGEVVRRTFSGYYSVKNLPESLYLHNYLNVEGAVGFGFGLPSDFAKGTERYASALKYRQNVSFFSGAKTFQQQSILSNAVFNPDGTKRSFKLFKEVAEKHNILYNKNYLKTELNGAFRIAQGAESWHGIQETKDIFPLLEYLTVGDSQVRDEHASWDGILLPTDDSFWDGHTPPNDWNCRCIIIQKRNGKTTNLTKHKQKYNKSVKKEMQVTSLRNTSKVFANNPGKTGIIYGKSHPYFDMPNKYKKSALNNFGFVAPADSVVKKAMKKII